MSKSIELLSSADRQGYLADMYGFNGACEVERRASRAILEADDALRAEMVSKGAGSTAVNGIVDIKLS